MQIPFFLISIGVEAVDIDRTIVVIE